MCTAGAYLVSSHGARLLNENWLPLSFNVDNQLSFLTTFLNLRTYWADPPVARQESIGRFKSSTNKHLALYTPRDAIAASLKALESYPDALHAGEVQLTLADSYFLEGANLRIVVGGVVQSP